MLDFHVQRFTRRCFESGRELKPGETFYSVLRQEGGEVVRTDYAENAWSGPPEDAVGWWKSKAPEPTSQRITWAPNDVILNYFCELEDAAQQRDLRFVLTLLMIRRRMLRLESTEKNAHGEEVMTLFCPRDETEHQVIVCEPLQERIEEIQNNLAALLFGDHDEPADDEPPQTNAPPD